jgi:hypothetical protein
VLSLEVSGVDLSRAQFEGLAAGLDGNESLRQVTLRDLPSLGGNCGAWPPVAAALAGSGVNCLSVCGCDLRAGVDADAVLSLLRRHQRKRDEVLWTMALRGGASGMAVGESGGGAADPVEALRAVAATGLLVLDLSGNGKSHSTPPTHTHSLLHSYF